MKRKAFILVATLLICSVCALAVYLGTLPRPRVNKANFDRIQVGMTYDEVVSLFGKHREPECFLPPVWRDDDGSEVMINFSEDFRVVDKFWRPSTETWMGTAWRVIKTQKETMLGTKKP